jgi:hypothetical protein
MSNQQVGRLAMRVEGDWWVAYYAMPNTMDGAIELGRIQMLAVQDKDRRQAFMDIMKAFVGDILEEKLGAKVDWPNPPQSAPESERSGRA